MSEAVRYKLIVATVAIAYIFVAATSLGFVTIGTKQFIERTVNRAP